MKLKVWDAWHRKGNEEERDVQVGDLVFFLCNGRGRGGHYMVHARVLKINQVTIDAVEVERSYLPGTRWRVGKNTSSIKIVREH